MNFSMVSEKKITPILSLFWMAEKARMAAISVITFFLVFADDPNSREPLTSTSSMTVSSLSSSNTLM